MIDTKKEAALNDFGKKLALLLPGFYGKVAFNIKDGKYINSNVERSIYPNNPKKGN